MDLELNGQVAIVTGAGRGIGRAIAEHLACAGMDVALLARTREELHQTAEAVASSPGRAMVLPTDVTALGGLEDSVRMVLNAWGRIDLLVHNAGSLTSMGPLWEADADEWRHDLEVNVYGVFAACRAVLPVMVEAGRGRVVNLAGGGAQGPFPFVSAYAASKCAVTRLTENLACELDATDAPVRVFAINPGFIRTEMTEQFERREKGRRWMETMVERFERGDDTTPDHVAKLVGWIAAGSLDAYHGRYLNAPADAPNVEALADGAAKESLAEDHRKLRVTGLRD